MIHVDCSGIDQGETQVSPLFGLLRGKCDLVFLPVITRYRQFFGFEDMIVLTDQFNPNTDRRL